MPDTPPKAASTTEEFESLLADHAPNYVLRLYVSGMTARSTEAIGNIRAICEEYLHGRYELEIIDVYKHPEMTGPDQIIATPTLVKELPVPLRRLVGTLSDEERVLVGLDLLKKD